MYQKSWLYAKLFLKYGVRRIQLLFFILGYFLLFYSPKNENFKTMKKKPGDIILLRKCTKNHDHMLYCSWDIVLEWCNCYFSFWAIFCPYTPPPLTARKMRKEKKKHLKISFYTSVPKIMMMYCTVPEICCVTCIFHFGLFLAL